MLRLPARQWLVAITFLAACARGQDAPASRPDTQAVASSTPEPEGAERSKRDSADFRVFVDSVNLLRQRVDSLGTNRAVAALLFRLGQMKRHADRWTCYGGPGWEYAKPLRDKGYYADEANACYVYNASDWKELIRMFPDDSLADDAAWGIAHHGVGGDCEGEIACSLGLRFVPMLDFLSQFPHSKLDSAAVEEANKALTNILGDIPDLSLRDTSSTVESVLARYDSAAVQLSPPLRSAVRSVTGPLWIRLGKPNPH